MLVFIASGLTLPKARLTISSARVTLSLAISGAGAFGSTRYSAGSSGRPSMPPRTCA